MLRPLTLSRPCPFPFLTPLRTGVSLSGVISRHLDRSSGVGSGVSWPPAPVRAEPVRPRYGLGGFGALLPAAAEPALARDLSGNLGLDRVRGGDVLFRAAGLGGREALRAGRSGRRVRETSDEVIGLGRGDSSSRVLSLASLVFFFSM